MKKLLTTLIFTFLCFSSFTQSKNEFSFKQIERLNLHDFKTFSEISSIEIELESRHSSRKHPGSVTGWILNETPIVLTVLNSAGQEIEINRTDIKNIKEFSKSEIYKSYLRSYSDMDSDNEILTRSYEGSEIIPYVLVAHWIYLNNSESGNSLINEFQEQLNYKLDTMLVHFYGNLYYNEMLVAFTRDRNRIDALKFGRHLSQPAFSDFLYFDQAKLLTEQLENRSEDFVSFKLPDSLNWVDIQKNLTRTNKIEYLLDRLRLLNCDQPGQPAWINYKDTQTSIPLSQIMKDAEVKYFSDGLKKYAVINPFNQLLKMEIQIDELPIFLPYLKSKEFITSYEYWRDFSSHRKLHPVAEVVLTLLYEITNKKFVERDFFSLPDEQKDLEIKKINEWIISNSNVSPEIRIKEILVSTNDWGEFKNAMNEAGKVELEDFFELLDSKIGIFKNSDWPSPDGAIMQMMMRAGSVEEIDVMSEYLQSDDDWVRLWSSLFLIKNDAASFDTSLGVLKEVLDSGDGSSYYPRAIPFLIDTKNHNLLKVAEGILEKNDQDDPFFSMMNEDILRRLILAGSQKTLEFFRSGLSDCRADNRMMATDENGNNITVLRCDNYVGILNRWRLDEYQYDSNWSSERRQQYSEQLSRWLTIQFERITNGEDHQLKATLGEPNLPHSFVDSPGMH